MRRTSIIAATVVLLSAQAHAADLVAERWLAPGADRIAALTTTPGDCLGAPDGENASRLAIGRAAFNSPRLFGGQAARAGLSCSSCHPDGRRNADFYIEGLSGAPGAADVTSALFSTVREDGVFNPVMIPSLVGGAERSSRQGVAALHDFIASAVSDEFAGAPPSPRVMEALVAYVAALRAATCAPQDEALNPRRAMGDVDRTLAAAQEALNEGDRPTADFLLASAQAGLGEIAERFPGEEAQGDRRALEALSRQIQSARQSSTDAQARELVEKIAISADRLGERLHKAQRRSLYDPVTLAAELERRGRK